MPKLGRRKLCDVWSSLEAAAPVHRMLENFLLDHNIPYTRHHGTDGYRREYYRYLVNSRDLCCAQAVLPALRELQGGIYVKASA